MKYKEFIGALENELKHVYLLSGKETFYIDKAREKILEKIGVDKSEVVTLDCGEKIPVSEIVSVIDSAPLFSPRNVVVIKNAPFFGKEVNSERLEKILSNMQETNFAIFTTENADKRRKLYKLIAKVGAVLDADLLRAWQTDDWLNEKLKSLGKVMYGEARKFFSERISILPEISLLYLENELDKVALIVPGKEITAEDLQRGMLMPPEVSNFALTDAIDARKLKKAVYVLRTQLRDAKNFPLMTALLVRHVRQLLRAKFFIKRGVRGRALAEPLEMNPYIAQKFGETATGYDTKLLEETFLELADADYKLKFGLAGAEILEKIVVKLCKRKRNA